MQTNQKFIQMFLVLISLFIFIFFTRWYYSDLIANMDINDEKTKIYNEKVSEVDKLSKKQDELKKAIKDWWKKSKQSIEIEKYLEKVTEDKVIEEIYWMAENNIVWVEILSLSMSEWVKNELGFLESQLNISAIVQNEKSIKGLFDYLNQSSKYKIFIKSFNMPKKPGVLGYKIQVPATIFYVESK